MKKIKGEFAGCPYETRIYDDKLVFDITVPPSTGTTQIGIPLSKGELPKSWGGESESIIIKQLIGTK